MVNDMKLGWKAVLTGDLPVDATSGGHPRRWEVYDLYEPEDPWGLVVYIHGGGWETGDKHRPPGFQSLLAAGLAIVAVSYRYSDEANVDGMIGDIVAAAMAGQNSLQAAGGSQLPVFLWGISAGGHLALLMAGGAAGMRMPDAVCSWCGPSDLPSLMRFEDVKEHCKADITKAVDKLAGTSGDKMQSLAQWSPITHVREGLPPHLFIHGDDDGLVPPLHSSRMHERLLDLGVASEYFEVAGMSHAMPPGHWEGTDRMIALFRAAADHAAGRSR